jgi:outer membrane protein assembly factor BamA
MNTFNSMVSKVEGVQSSKVANGLLKFLALFSQESLEIEKLDAVIASLLDVEEVKGKMASAVRVQTSEKSGKKIFEAFASKRGYTICSYSFNLNELANVEPADKTVVKNLVAEKNIDW